MAENNATSPKPNGSAPQLNDSNTSMHKLRAMGHKTALESASGKKTPA